MKMIERVARAICDSLEADDYASLPEGSIVKAAYRQQARAAIEAMREPTRAMQEAGYIVTVDDEVEVWQVMIDAALTPTPHGLENERMDDILPP